MGIIEVSNITKDYGNNKGVFDVTFSVNKGEILGFLGPNGEVKQQQFVSLWGLLGQIKVM